MNILAVPTTSHQMMVDCDDCGPLGVIERMQIHSYAAWHLATEHGIEPPLMDLCDCGYNHEQPTGHHLDQAYCNDCDWWTTGIGADHAAHHHHLDTRHAWRLENGNRYGRTA